MTMNVLYRAGHTIDETEVHFKLGFGGDIILDDIPGQDKHKEGNRKYIEAQIKQTLAHSGIDEYINIWRSQFDGLK